MRKSAREVEQGWNRTGVWRRLVVVITLSIASQTLAIALPTPVVQARQQQQIRTCTTYIQNGFYHRRCVDTKVNTSNSTNGKVSYTIHMYK